MPVLDRIREYQADMSSWRRDIHAHPEIAYEEVRTADVVAQKLTEFGIPIHRGMGKTGVVGTLKVGNGNRAIALRADMDALELDEKNTFAHASKHAGKMHACGHDGHSTMLLGAARYLAETRRFNGTVHFIFQPAEEGRNGAKAMIDDGLFEKFPVESVYGMHNMPGFDAGKILVRSGPMMASADFVRIRIQGKGGHAAFPHQTVDPVLIAAQLIQAIQGIVARNVDPLEAGVVTIAMIHGGHARNIIPDDVELQGTARAFSTKMQELIQDRLQKLCDGIAAAHGAKIELHYERLYPPTVNTEDETKEAAAAAAEVVGRENVQWNPPPAMGAEDFAWMLREKPGSYVWIGNGAGEGGCMLHNPHYDFNDDILPVGASYWVALTERLLKVD